MVKKKENQFAMVFQKNLNGPNWTKSPNVHLTAHSFCVKNLLIYFYFHIIRRTITPNTNNRSEHKREALAGLFILERKLVKKLQSLHTKQVQLAGRYRCHALHKFRLLSPDWTRCPFLYLSHPRK